MQIVIYALIQRDLGEIGRLGVTIKTPMVANENVVI